MTRLNVAESRSLAIAVLGPLSVVGLAYVLWWISDRLLYVGPFDRATFGWLVVVPLWILSPAVAAMAWRDLPSGVTRGAATLAGLVIGSGTSALLWLAFNPAACETSPRTSAAGLIVPSLVVGGVVGIGWVIAGLIGSEAAGTRPWRGVVLSTGLAIGHLVVILGVFTWAVLSFGGCNRPGTI